MGTTADDTPSATASIQGDNPEGAEVSMISSTGRPTRSAASRGIVENGRARRSRLNEDSEDDASESDYGGDEEDDADEDADEHVPEEEEDEDEEEEDEFDDNEAMVEDDLDAGPLQKLKLVVKLSATKGKGHNFDPSDGSVDMTDAPAPVPGTPASEAGASNPNPHLSTPKSPPVDDETAAAKGAQATTSLAFRSPDKMVNLAA